MTYYKTFNRDMTCRDFKYEEGGVYEIDEKPILCERGFHFVKDLVLSLGYYPVNNWFPSISFLVLAISVISVNQSL